MRENAEEIEKEREREREGERDRYLAVDSIPTASVMRVRCT